MSDNLKEKFWDRLEDTRTGMLSTDTARAVPMSHYVDDDDKSPALWFITAKNTDVSTSSVAGVPAQYIVTSNDEALYARIDGTLTHSNDRAQLDRIWNAVAETWFEDGKQDDDLQLLRLDLREAEVWATGGSLKFLYEIAKSKLTDNKPDMGEHGTLRF